MQTTTLPATSSTQLDIVSLLNLILPMVMVAMMTKMMAGAFGKQEESEAVQ
jgi:hypothetical protein